MKPFKTTVKYKNTSDAAKSEIITPKHQGKGMFLQWNSCFTPWAAAIPSCC